MNNALRYIDEKDKSYGIAGMAISLVACDCEEYISSVSLEADEEPISFTSNFRFTGNPNLSAKSAWNEHLKQFQVVAGMLLANVMCRNSAVGRGFDKKALLSIREIIKTLGSENCSLDEDEIDNIYNKSYRYYTEIFSHPSVATIARDFATTLRMKRRLSAGEILDELRQFNSL